MNNTQAANLLNGAMAVLTAAVNVLQIPGVQTITRVNSNPGGAILLNVNDASQGGFLPQFQDEGGSTLDQAHHFAAFFQLGFSYGASAGGMIAQWLEQIEGTASNQGDINLGTVAARIGSYVKSGVLPVSEVAATISGSLCKT